MGKIHNLFTKIRNPIARLSSLDWMGVAVLLLLFVAIGLAYYEHQNDSRIIGSLRDELVNAASKESALADRYQKLEAIVREKDAKIAENERILTERDAELQKRDATIQDLNRQITSLKSLRVVAPAPKAVAGSIYDRIRVNAPFRDQIIRALKLIEGATPEYFSKINSQVAYINETSMCGGWQLTRDINIGSCNGTFPDSIVATMIIHESMHVYNVYVSKIYSMQTKEQELPCYLAEREVEERLGVPQYYRDMTTQKIAYWSQQ